MIYIYSTVDHVGFSPKIREIFYVYISSEDPGEDPDEDPSENFYETEVYRTNNEAQAEAKMNELRNILFAGGAEVTMR